MIIKVDGYAVQSPQDVVSAVQSRKPGDKLTLVVKRDGADKELTATLGDNPDKKGTAWLGVSLSARMQTPATKSDGKEGSLPWSELHGQSL